MKFHPLAQGYLQGAIIQPLPSGCQSGHQLAILIDLHKVLEDVPGNICPVQGILVHDAQFSARCGDLCPCAALAPPEGNKHKDKTANHEVFHDYSSLVSWLDAVLFSLLLGGWGYKR